MERPRTTTIPADRIPRVVLVPMEIETIETRGESVTVHGYVGDYGVTFHAKASDFEALAAESRRFLPDEPDAGGTR